MSTNGDVYITPDRYDIVVVGTGLQGSLIASSAALCGKRVLHLDNAPYYGDAWSSLSIDEFVEHISEHQRTNDSSLHNTDQNLHPIAETPRLYRNVEVVAQKKEFLNDPSQRQYVIDLAPRVTYQSDPLIQALVKTQAYHYVDYKLVDAHYAFVENALVHIPSSRADIFKDRSLTPIQKRTLTAFLKDAVSILQSDTTEVGEFDSWIDGYGFDEKMSGIVKSGVCFSDAYTANASKFKALGLYLQSAGRFKSDSCPFVTSVYGVGDVPQAFCRVCAVRGGIYALNCGVQSIRYTMDSKDLLEVITTHGQSIHCSEIAFPSYYMDVLPTLKALFPRDVQFKWKHLSRVVCVIDRSIRNGEHQLLVTIPRERSSSIHFLQVTAPCCPVGKYVLYGSCPAEKVTAKEDLSASLHALISACDDATRPEILFECYYNQGHASLSSNALPRFCFYDSCPDSMIGNISELQSAERDFSWLYSEDSFLSVPAEARVASLHGEGDDDIFAELENALADMGTERDDIHTLTK